MYNESECKFPFKYNQNTYEKCTKVGTTARFISEEYWCATAVDEYNNMIKGHWGICSDRCGRYGNITKKFPLFEIYYKSFCFYYI